MGECGCRVYGRGPATGATEIRCSHQDAADRYKAERDVARKIIKTYKLILEHPIVHGRQKLIDEVTAKSDAALRVTPDG